MRQKKIWLIQSFILCLIFNGICAIALYQPLHEVIKSLKQYIKPISENQELKQQLPESLLQFISNMREFIDMMGHYAPWFLFGVIGAVTLVLWIALCLVGTRRIRKAMEETSRVMPPSMPPKEPKTTTEPEKTPPEVPRKDDEKQRLLPAVQLLAMLQRDGRFIDFLQEDLTPYDDAQIGATVRALHEDWRRLFREYAQMEPIYKEPDGTEVTVMEGFDTAAIRLTGRVIGNPPFRGIIRHKGWRLVKLDLPHISDPESIQWIIAPAEVEVKERDDTHEGSKREGEIE